MVTRIGVDIGGTFTDLVYFDEKTGATVEGKVPTVPRAPEEGVLKAVREHVPAEVLADSAYFLHGTTVGLNALLERRGAKVGLLCTAGLRDILEIRRGDRAEMYNPFWEAPEPLVPRHLRLGIVERMRADGIVHFPLDPASVRGAVAQLMAERVDSIAICLMNGYANPAHEIAVAELAREAGFTGGISLSHLVSGEYREYERTSTTVIDAFVRGRMADYLQRLESDLRALGFKGQCLITRSGGGSMSFREAEERPFETIMSGPVAGAQGAAEVARHLGIDALLTADVGGTSFDTTLIVDGEPTVLYEGVVDGMPVQTSWVDVRSIGAGGGSIAKVDRGGLMQVGPQSAAADPGPAAYGKGGIEPTLTDAAAHLGMLGPGQFKAGISLDFDKAKTALSRVATGLGRTVDEAAVGILRIAAANMGNAMREITVERGLDPRSMTLLPFGGAGPLMAVLLADELSVDSIVVPPLAGNFSAWGLLGADMIQSVARTSIIPLDADGITGASALFSDLLAALTARGDTGAAEAIPRGRLDLRYRGQEHWLSTDVAVHDGRLTEDTETIGNRFREGYLRTFGGLIDQPIEIVSIRATRTVPLPRREGMAAPRPGTGGRGGAASWPAYSFAKRQTLDFAVLERDDIAAPVSGPVIITESTATLYVDAGWLVTVGASRELLIQRRNA